MLDRFRRYLDGGVSANGMGCHPGCRDPTPPSGSRVVWLPGRLTFGETQSRAWGPGAVAFVDGPGRLPDGVASHFLARLYRVRLGQFADLAAQENGYVPGEGPHAASFLLKREDLAALAACGGESVHRCLTLPVPRRYNEVAYFGQLDGLCVLTLTRDDRRRASHEAQRQRAIVAPALAYRETLLQGLAECGLTTDEAEAYLARGVEASATSLAPGARGSP